MTYYCRTCPRIIEEDDIDLCCECRAALCLRCSGDGIDPELGTDQHPEPPCIECDGQGIDEDRQAEIRAISRDQQQTEPT